MVTAVMIVTVAAGIAAYLVSAPEKWGRQAANMASFAQADTLARAAVDWARVIVYENAQSDTAGKIGEKGPVVIETFPVEEATMSLAVDDAQGRFNLNNLVSAGKASDRDIMMFRRLLNALGLPRELADSLTDWMDDDEQVRPGGAESAQYLVSAPPRRASNRPLGSVGELALVRGFDKRAIDALKPYVAVIPARAPVNANTASAMVLAAVFNGLSMKDAESLMESRASTRFDSVANVRERLPKSVTDVNDNDFSVKSSYFTVTATCGVDRAKIKAEALLEVGGDNKNWPKIAWYWIT